MPSRRRRKRRRRNSRAGVFVLFLLATGVLYITYIAVTQPEAISAGRDTAPVIAMAGEDRADEANELNEFDEDEPNEGFANINGDDSNVTLNTEINISDLQISPNDGEPLSLSLSGDESAFTLSAPNDAQVAYSSGRTEPGENNMNPFRAFSYYIPENQLEYEVYQDNNLSFSAENVVWMVNAGLYRSFYTSPNLITDSNPLLINPYNQLPEDFVPRALVEIDDSGRLAAPEAIEAFRQMRAGAIAAGFDLAVTSAYRTMDYQRGLYERESGDGAVARPTFSEHHTGRALDLWGPDGLLDEADETDTGRWVAEHAHEYGFIVRYTAENRYITGYIPEPWHITYVGTEISNDMHRGGYGSLEEYVAKNPRARL